MSTGFQPAFGDKNNDVLIQAQAGRKVEEQKSQIEAEFKMSIEEIEKHFELRKKDLLHQNQLEIE